MKKFVSILLNLCLGLFLADGIVSLVDDTLIVFKGTHVLGGIRGALALSCVLASFLTYIFMGITPMIPKRFFLPVTLFFPAASLASIPIAIYHFDQLSRATWVLSLLQVLLGFGLLAWLHRGFRFRSQLIPDEWLGDRKFSWLNLFGFILGNAVLLVPCVLVYFGWCLSLAVDHFSAGFMALRSDRLVVRTKEYVRDDGKTVYLIPMVHIGEPGFYQRVMNSFPTNATILLEGVTDRKNLLKQPLSYKRVASSLGLSEQKEQFEPTKGHLRPADVDVEEFSKKTIEFLNLAILIHAKGPEPEVILRLVQETQDSFVAKNLFEDLLIHRNEHVLKELEAEIPQSEKIVVPWGAAHMPGIAEGVQKAGFREKASQEYDVLYYQTVLKNLNARQTAP